MDQLEAGSVALLGVPSDENSSFLRGAAAAPGAIREALYCDATNLCTEHGLDLGCDTRFHDLGDLELGETNRFQAIETAVAALVEQDVRVLALGGDHAISYPVLRAFAKRFGELSVLHIDAHPDLYQDFRGNPLSHASPFARIMEEGLVSRLLQVGIRASNPHLREQAERFAVETIHMTDYHSDLRLDFRGPVYVSLDLDGLDPACAPGVSHPEPGGLSTREVIRLLHGIGAPVVGADIVS